MDGSNGSNGRGIGAVADRICEGIGTDPSLLNGQFDDSDVETYDDEPTGETSKEELVEMLREASARELPWRRLCELMGEEAKMQLSALDTPAEQLKVARYALAPVRKALLDAGFAPWIVGGVLSSLASGDSFR